MADGLSVAVVPVVDGRLAVMLIDPATLKIRGPDAGDDHTGYTADEIRPILAKRYGLSAPDIEEQVAAALNPDIEERIAAALAKAAGS